MHHVPLWVKLASTVAMLTGLFTAWMMYIRKPGFYITLAGHFEPLYKFFQQMVFLTSSTTSSVKPAFWFGRLFWKGATSELSTASASNVRRSRWSG